MFDSSQNMYFQIKLVKFHCCIYCYETKSDLLKIFWNLLFCIFRRNYHPADGVVSAGRPTHQQSQHQHDGKDHWLRPQQVPQTAQYGRGIWFVLFWKKSIRFRKFPFSAIFDNPLKTELTLKDLRLTGENELFQDLFASFTKLFKVLSREDIDLSQYELLCDLSMEVYKEVVASLMPADEEKKEEGQAGGSNGRQSPALAEDDIRNLVRKFIIFNFWEEIVLVSDTLLSIRKKFRDW